jgi:hypothetical protein
MNFFETLFEGIDLENEIDVNENETFEMSEDDFEQAIEVMEANKFLAQTKLDALNVEKACLEAEIADINGFFLGEGLSDVKDKALELWEKFKEWVEGILAKVKVFFAKFAMSRKQMAVLGAQLEKISSEKATGAVRHLGLTNGRTAVTALANGGRALATAAGALTVNFLTAADVTRLKTAESAFQTAADQVETAIKNAIDNDEYSGAGVAELHGMVVRPIGTLVKMLEQTLKSAKKLQMKKDRLDRGVGVNLDSEAVTQMRGIINAGNKVYASAIKYFFYEVKITKNIISYAGKETKLSTSEKKDMNKIKGRVKF